MRTFTATKLLGLCRPRMKHCMRYGGRRGSQFSVCGPAMAVEGRYYPLGAHGFVVVLCAGLDSVILAAFWEPDEAGLSRSYDHPTKAGIVVALAWAVLGMLFRVSVAALLAWPDLTFDAAWASFGRMRRVHTSGVIFGFGGHALIATSSHLLQRTWRARLPDQLSPVVLADRLQPFLRVCGDRLSGGGDAVQALRRVGTAGPLADDHLGNVLHDLHPQPWPRGRCCAFAPSCRVQLPLLR
jgi:hypothetical protein